MHLRNEYYYLSNMFPCDITMSFNNQTLTFPCAESVFQAFKCPEMANDFATSVNGQPIEAKCPDGYKAKKAGRRVPLRHDWESVKIRCMAMAVHAKFKQHPELMAKLSALHGDIVEDNTWNDRFWGRCNGTGENWLGRILETCRAYPPTQGFTPADWLRHLGVEA